MPKTSQEVTCRNCGLTFVPSFRFDFYSDGADPETGLCESCMMAEMFSSKPSFHDPVALPVGYEAAVCKIGQGEATCSFLGITGKGTRCLKGSSFDSQIRERRTKGTMRSKGDNCSGPPDFKPDG